MTSIATTARQRVELPGSRRQLFIASIALLSAGALLGVSTNLVKVAHGIGIPPLTFLTWSLAGATLLLTAISMFRGQTPRVNWRSVEYFLVAAVLSVAGSNLIFYNAVTHVGVSFVALTISLPPLLTYVGALMLGMESFCWWRASGVVMALVGTGVLVRGQWTTQDANHFWIALTLIGPVLLAAGNIYRTRRWPPGERAESLAPGMLLASTGLLLTVTMIMPGWTLGVSTESTYALPLIGIQAVVFAGQVLLLFVLQKAGGPVFLSLMGAVSAVVAVPIAMVLLAEPALPALLPSVALIAAGIVSMLVGARVCPAIIAKKGR